MSLNSNSLGAQPDGTYVFASARMGELQKEIERMNRRARKIGGGLGIEIVGERLVPRQTESGHKYVLPVTIVRVWGEVPKVAGCTFLARIEHHAVGNIVARAPNAPESVLTPESARTAAPTCDHCGQLRRRNDTFLMICPDGQIKQIGRNCLADFLRGADPTDALRMWKLLADLTAAFGSDSEDGCGGGGAKWLPTVDDYLACTCAAVRVHGWFSRTIARERDCESTANYAMFLTFPPPNKRKQEWEANQPTDDDRAEAAAVLAWTETLSARSDLSDYLHNVRVACALGYVDLHRNAGIVASAVMARRKELEIETARVRAAARPMGAHVGKVGERLVLELEVVRVRYSDGQYGTTSIVALVDGQGNEFTWFASGTKNWEPGTKLAGKGTVKKHEEYRGRPQTTLTRCAFEVLS